MSDDGKTGGGKPIVELLHAIGERYQISGIEDRDEIRREVIFSLQNEISKEDALRFIDPSFPPDVIRELLLARLEGVPADRLEEIRTLDVKEAIYVSRIRKRYYEELLQNLKYPEEEIEEAETMKTGVVKKEQAKADTFAMNGLYAETLHQFVSEIRLLVADQQKANQAAMELITRKESDEKEEYITLMRLQEKEIEALRESAAEKDDRISSLQEEVQVQIAKMLEFAEEYSTMEGIPVKRNYFANWLRSPWLRSLFASGS